MNTIVIQSVTYMPNDVAIVTGTVNGIAATAQTWQSALTKGGSTMAAQALLNTVNIAVSTIVTTYNGTVTL